MLIKEYIKLPALSGEAERRVYYYLPDDHAEGQRYPVLYMFDGHNLFYDSDATYGRSWRLGEYLQRTGAKVIVVGVECNHAGNRRLCEYSPVDFTFRGETIKGDGDIYMRWLTEELKPRTDDRFPTLADRAHTSIGGSFMGGLMSLYAVTEYNDVFSGAAALSPSLFMFGNRVPYFIGQACLAQDTRIFASFGTREFPRNSVHVARFLKTVEELKRKGACVTVKVTQGGTHSEQTWEGEIPFFMQALGLCDGQ